jgi:hypothetical protein
MKKSLIFATLAVLLATSLAVGSVLACTTRTPGYWKTHGPGSKHEDWPATGTVVVGSITYDLAVAADQDALLAILWDRPRGDAWIILAQKVIAAQLSIGRYPSTFWSDAPTFDDYPGGMVGMITDANALLAAAGSYMPGDAGRGDVTELAGTIDYWLNYWDEYGL